MSPLILVGPALCVELGLGPALALLVLVVGIADRRAALLGRARVDPGALSGPLRGLSAAAIVVIAAVLVAVGARTIAAVTIAFPAAIGALGLGLVVALIAGSLRPSLRRLGQALVVVGALAVPWAAATAEHLEAGGVDAGGSATSGPILGTHPFQVISVVVDGFGPFDLPINDYVEPDGARGYGPKDLADALERALHRIAEVHYDDGPARARLAFEGATAQALELPATLERLDLTTDGAQAMDARFVVRSGSHGQRSRVEFVCPGIREDPRPRPADTVMERMCPDRHAAEGSAGLGVTGRWTGYTETRGNEQLGLGRLLGWTRSDDAIGRANLLAEARIVAFAVIGLCLLLLVRRRPQGIETARALEGWGALTVAVAAGLGVLFFLVDLHAPVVGLVERPPAAIDWSTWAPLCLLFAALAEIGQITGEAAPRARRLAAALVVLAATFAVAGAPAMLPWIEPEIGLSIGPDRAFQAWILGVGDRLHGGLGIDLQVAEACVAGVVVAAALGLCVHASRVLGGAAGALLPGLQTRRFAPAAPLLAIAAIAAGLCVSRQTEGGALLLAPALLLSATVAAAWAVHGAIGGRRLVLGLLLVGSAALTLLALALAGFQGPVSLIRGLYLGLGAALTVAVAAAGWLRRPRSGP